MDCTTQCSTQNKQNKKHYLQEKNDMFLQFNQDISITDSLANQFDTFRYQLKSQAYLQKTRSRQKKNDSSNQKQLQNYFDSKLNEDKNSNQQQYQKVERTQTIYKSLQKEKQEFSPTNGNNLNKISLLRSSLQLQQSSKNQKQNKNPQIKQIDISGGNISSKYFGPSVQNTIISDNFKIPSVLMQADRKQSQQEASSAKKGKKKFRIQKPDQIFSQLQVQTQRKTNINEIVKKNINNTKAIIDLKNKDQNQMQIKGSNHLIMLSKKVTSENNLPKVFQIKSSQRFQTISSTCLARLPSPSIYQSIKQYYTNQYYHKYTYLLNEQQLLIDNSYHIKYKDITKIKMIYNEFNRPQLKISYTTFQYKQVETLSNSKQLTKENTNAKNKIDPRQSFCTSQEELKKNGEQLVLFLCQCYQSMYTVFSCIIMRKLFGLNQQKQKNMLKDKKKDNKLNRPNVSVNLSQFVVNTNFINCKNPNSDKNQKIINFDYPIQGVLLKKSRHIKKWQRRYIKIQNFYLRSYRIQNIQKNKQKKQQKRPSTEVSSVASSMTSSKQSKHQSSVTSSVNSNIDVNISNIPVYLPLSDKEKVSEQCTFEIENIKQLWTRFDVIEEKYLVFKIFKKNKFQKIQIAIPISNYCDVLVKDNWLFAFVGLLKGEI